MLKRKDVSAMIGHPYFRASEGRHEAGTGLELALEEIAARKRKTEALRAARLGADANPSERGHEGGDRSNGTTAGSASAD